jgi:SPP1 family predicted phage head-tail adaptor
MNFSSQSFQITILRRPVDPTDVRGAFSPAFSRWASIRQTSGQEIVQAGLDQSAINMVIRLRDDSDTRTITAVDRASVRGDEFAIVNVSQPDRRGGYIEILLRREIGG